MYNENAENGIVYFSIHCVGRDFSSASFVMYLSYTGQFMTSLFQAEQSLSGYSFDYTENTTCYSYAINH